MHSLLFDSIIPDFTCTCKKINIDTVDENMKKYLNGEERHEQIMNDGQQNIFAFRVKDDYHNMDSGITKLLFENQLTKINVTKTCIPLSSLFGHYVHNDYWVRSDQDCS